MIVDEYDRRRPLGDRFPEHLARVHEGGVQDAARHRDVALQPVLRVEHRDVKLLDRQVLEPRREQIEDVSRRADRRALLPRLRRQAPPQLEGRVYGDRTGCSNPGQRSQRRHRLRGEPPERPVAGRQHRVPHADRRPPGPSGADDDRQQLGCAQALRAVVLEPLPGPLPARQLSNT
jgi:hypothetical protein